MFLLTNSALSRQFSPATFSSNGILDTAHGGTDWNEIGMRIAFSGGSYSLILVGVLLALASFISCFGGPTLAPSGDGVFLQIFVMLAAGFPFLLCSCFLFSTLVAVPLVSIIAWTAKRTKVQISPRWVTAVGIVLVVIVWTSLIYCAACWSSWV